MDQIYLQNLWVINSELINLSIITRGGPPQEYRTKLTILICCQEKTKAKLHAR